MCANLRACVYVGGRGGVHVHVCVQGGDDIGVNNAQSYISVFKKTSKQL